MQSVVFWVVFHLGFEFLVIGDFTGFVPLFAGVVVTDVPEFAGARPVAVKRICDL